MKHVILSLSLLTLHSSLITLHAAVPLKWTVETSRAVPAQFEAYQGETLAFEAALQSYGKPLEAPANYSLYWQTNGMGNAWWSTNVSNVSNISNPSNLLRATWTPSMETGAKVYNCFIGKPGTIYHAAFQLRLRPSPGAIPNELPLPQKVIDFAKVTVLNPPWSGGGGGGGVDTNAVLDIIHKTVDGSARYTPKFLWVYDCSDSYPEDAAEYYRSRGDGKVDGGCSAVRDGGFLYRNFDFPFDERAEFVVKMSAANGRFASVGVAQVGTNLTEQMVTSGKPEYSKFYKWLPGATVDGVNENGVVCEINVVGGTPPVSTGGDIHPLGAVRWALDNGTSAGMVASNLSSRVAFPAGWEQNFHWMVADERETWIVENGTAYPIIGHPVMTNFRIAVDPPDGPGIERYNILMNPENSITNAWYTRAYRRETNPPWVSDLAEVIAYTNDIFDAWAAHDNEYFRGKTNSGKPWWQSIHTSIYDITNRTLRVAVQEQDDWYTFAVPSAGGVKPEAVRKIVDGSFIGGTNAVNAAMSEISNKLDSESIIPGTPYKASLKWENIGDGYELVMNGVPFHVYGGLFKVDSLESIMVGGIPLSSTLSWLLPVSPDRELYPNPMIFWSGSQLNVNGSATIYQGLSVAAPVIATAFEPYGWENYHANDEQLPAYLASGRWNTNTGTNRFARIGDIPPQLSTTTLRLYDETRDCYWIGKMVNGVLNWEVE